MIANAGYIHRFLEGSNKKFIIPVYQRPYSWKKENCELLFNDLMDTYIKNYNTHFFGGIVYVSNDIGGINEYIIIDGQQRVTTVSILLLAIRNYILDNNVQVDINPRKITNAYLADEYADDEKKLKLKLVQGDDCAYDKLISQQIPIENNSVTANYNYFYNKIEGLTATELKGLYDAVMKLEIVNISLDISTGDDPQLIFESLNSTGVGLDEADKIRNYVLMNMKAKEQEKFYKKYWEVLEKLVSRSDINKFIRYYLATKTYELANEKKLYFEYKHYKQINKIDSEEMLKDMLLYGEWYSIIKNSQINAKDYRCVLARLNKLEVNSCIPLLFDIFNANKLNLIDEEELEMAFIIIENYIVRRTVCGLATNQLNKVFVALGSEIKRYMERDNVSYFSAFVYAILIKSGKSRFPNNHDFADKFMTFELYNARPIIKKYFMERLENNSTKEKIAVEEQIDNGTLTIEHIMPQRLNSEWKKALGDNWELVHSKYKDTIGNLTLTAYNSDYSNLSFLKKKEMPDKGFNYSKLDLNKYLKNCDFWNEDTITGRAKLLFEEAEQLWWLPETDYCPHEEEQWICWDEDFDFTNILITKIKFMGDEIDTSNISDAYKKLNTLIYDLDSVTYLSEENTAYSYIENDYRSPIEIASGIYVESNLSSSSKITAISKIAKLYKLESDDIKFLVKAKEKKLAFDIANEESYASLTVGQLAFKLFENLITSGKVSVEEIELFKDKAYTKSKFNRTDYPAIANNREDNKGRSSNIRYRKTPILFNGTEIYISTQWFEGNRGDLIAWYRKHV
jgi:uncharacterized protein with ParB-like and HNH nuclease domain